ncbi:hypothetical protein BT63DRAFT_375237 [Microthyrium microscopicum]|uniref:Cell surface spherulin 4-like protein n=1 Tax=Microthyrium microscopicum TaxID=703497 RepID=A0A6A6UA15_9PEZI|nr:hypothetical protein BT63DRAFT_375237 [Microthyrium microscopicum]
MRRRKKAKLTAIIGCAILVVLLAIIIPVAVYFHNKRPDGNGLPSSLLFPLYIYPTAGAWDPLFTAITANKNLNFTVVVNPQSGPGNTSYPGDAYADGVIKLNSFPNVQTIGYVRTSWAARNITEVLGDISTYNGWAQVNGATKAGMAVDGIFFDESPSQYTQDGADFVKTVNAAVKSASGFGGNKTIIHNPGTTIDTRLAQANTDITIVFEGNYTDFLHLEPSLAALPVDRTRNSYVIHTAPQLSVKDLAAFLGKASQHASHLFATSLDGSHPYESFGPDWLDLISAHPNVQFTIIVNPHDGPGAGLMPDEYYSVEIPKLNAFPNVRTVGYVRVNYCTRDVTEVCNDVAKYAGWSKDFANTGLGVEGIFFDETPNSNTSLPQLDNVASYLQTVSRYAKDSEGILGDRLIIHNPGTPPDVEVGNAGADVTTVVEESFASYESPALQEYYAARYALLPDFDRAKRAYMVHSTPVESLSDLVLRLRDSGDYLFITDLCEDYYCKFGHSWLEFVRAVGS